MAIQHRDVCIYIKESGLRMNEELLKELKAYRDEMVARNYPFQRISDIITKWEMKNVVRDTSNDPFKGTSMEGKD